MKQCLLAFLCTLFFVPAFAQFAPSANAIAGDWITEKGNLIMRVYCTGKDYYASIVWYENTKDGIPMDERLDTKNPKTALRKRKILGMNVLKGLKYDKAAARWVNGSIYDATSGKTWSANAHITSSGKLTVRGYWMFEMFGKSISFVPYVIKK